MARKRHSDEDILKLLREIELKLSAGADVASACRGVGISDATYYNWRKRFGGMGIQAVYRRPNTSKPVPGHKVYPYLLRKLAVTRANQVWAMDITYIPMARGFV